jgi:hypothetical protein
VYLLTIYLEDFTNNYYVAGPLQIKQCTCILTCFSLAAAVAETATAAVAAAAVAAAAVAAAVAATELSVSSLPTKGCELKGRGKIFAVLLQFHWPQICACHTDGTYQKPCFVNP